MKFLYKNGNFLFSLKTKSDPNIHQNAPNCTILEKSSRGDMPPNPLAERMALRDMQISKSEKKNSWPPPCQILATPLGMHYVVCTMWYALCSMHYVRSMHYVVCTMWHALCILCTM